LVSDCFLITARLPRPTLFPYTTLFRSRRRRVAPARPDARDRRHEPVAARPLGGHADVHGAADPGDADAAVPRQAAARPSDRGPRSEEHTSELQSRENLVCRLLLEKKKY